MKSLRKWWGLAVGFALVSAPAMALAQQGRPYYGDHMWGSGWGGWFYGPMKMIFWLVLMVGAVVLVLRWLGVTEKPGRRSSKPGPDAMDLLRERFAKGEIDKAEFEERRALLER